MQINGEEKLYIPVINVLHIGNIYTDRLISKELQLSTNTKSIGFYHIPQLIIQINTDSLHNFLIDRMG